MRKIKILKITPDLTPTLKWLNYKIKIKFCSNSWKILNKIYIKLMKKYKIINVKFVYIEMPII